MAEAPGLPTAGPRDLAMAPFVMTPPQVARAALRVGLFALLGLAGAVRGAETALVQDILDGKELYIDQEQARPRQTARAPQQVRTGNSRGQLLFNTGAVGRLNTFSHLRLGSGCFLVDRGQVLVSGRQNGCTRSARLSVRGTNYVLEVREDGGSEISVLEGSVEVEPLREGEPTGAPPSLLEAGQRLRLSPLGVVTALLTLEAGDYAQILRGPLFQGFPTPLPGLDNLRSLLESRFPGLSVPLPLPVPTPSLPSLGLPRFF